MKNDQHILRDLFSRWIKGEATSSNEDDLLKLLSDDPANAQLYTLMKEEWSKMEPGEGLSAEKKLQIVERATGAPRTAITPRIHFLRTAWFRYAAVLLLIAGTATFLYKANQQPQKETASTGIQKQSTDIQPGGNKAILTLSDGSTIVLDSAATGNLATQGSTKIIKLNSGALAYAGTRDGAPAAGMNTLRTPKGGQYQVTLPDGTKVWLNAASSITFPAAFANRSVTVTGEAYFEIAADRTKPFVVSTPTDIIHVLGTSFNVNAYEDEPAVRTTLVEGSIKVGNTELKPGQVISADKVTPATIEKDLAWKNGFIHFAGRPLIQVMREIARWYDIEVIYEQGVPAVKLWGEMSRNVSLQAMIAGLESAELHVKLDGRRLIVFPK